MKSIIKIICFTAIITLVLSMVTVFSTSAKEKDDFYMDKFDKAYVTFTFDDGNMPFAEECFDIFKKFDMPMSCSLIAQKVQNNKEAIKLFKKVETAGGEIFSHTYDHGVIEKSNSNLAYIEKELGDSFRVLTGLGFNINGAIETGNGGNEATADYELIETVSRKYYKYSNAYGVSPQYKKERIWLRWNTLDSMKARINTAIKNKEWIVIAAHSFDEFSPDNLKALLKYINSCGKNKVSVVTWKYIYDNFGNYSGPKVPTDKAIESVCEMMGHDLKNPTVYKKASCEMGPVYKGVCKTCGKTATTQSKEGALGHKFGKFVSDNNATCLMRSTKTAKCIRKGCNETRTEEDLSSPYGHKLKMVIVREATPTKEGLAEYRCTLCDYVEKVVIPKGKKAQDIKPKENPKKENTQQADLSKPDTAVSKVQTAAQTEQKAEDGKPSFDSTVVKIIAIAVLAAVLTAGIIVLIYVIKKRKV